MKSKINILISISVATMLLLLGCSNSVETERNENKYTVIGNISFGNSKGAGPDFVASVNSNNRNATTSFDDVHFTCNLYAYKCNEDWIEDTAEKIETGTIDSKGAFVFSFENKGSYKIHADLLRDGTKIASGSAKVEITGYTSNLINIPAKPLVTGNGKISLEAGVESSAREMVKAVNVRWTGSLDSDDIMEIDGHGREQENPDFKAAMQIREKVQNGAYNKSFPVSNGKAQISYDSFPGGSYGLYLNFEDANGNTLYGCQEIISVYPGFTTNLWYGTSSFYKNGIPTVSASMIDSYDPEIVPNFNKVLLWNYYEDDGSGNSMEGQRYYLVNENNIQNALPSNATAYTQVQPGWSSYSTTFFDADGNFYLVQYSDDAPGEGSGISSTKSGWHFISWNDLGFSWELDKDFTVDLKTNIVYAIKAMDGPQIAKYENMISSSGVDYSYTNINLDLDSMDVYQSVIYDGKAYLLFYEGDGVYNITIFDLDSGDNLRQPIRVITVNLATLFDSYSFAASIKDMLYQDGVIYLLYNEGRSQSGSNPNQFCRGAVIKINLSETNPYPVYTGLTNHVLAKNSGFKLYAYDYQIERPLYLDQGNTRLLPNPAEEYVTGLEWDDVAGEEKTVMGTVLGMYQNLYFPDGDEKSFYGPTKFIAIKPKKLVISDEGYAFYTKADGILYYKNVNRIVYVDLDTFSISEVKIVNSSVKFTEDYNGIFPVTGNLINMEHSQNREKFSPYVYDESTLGYTPYSGNIYVGIEKGE